MKAIEKNHILFYTYSALYNCAFLIISGSVLQTFMMECGISDTKVSFYVSFVQILQTAIMFISSKRVENTKNIFVSVALCIILQIPLFAVVLYISVTRSVAPDTAFILIMVASFILSIAQGIKNVAIYKLPHHIIDMKDYGKIMGNSGVIIGVLGVVFTGLLTFVMKRLEYFSVMAVFSAIGISFYLVSGWITMNYHKREPEFLGDVTEKINIFKYRPFYILLIPNLLRGFSAGVFGLAAVVGFSEKVLDSVGAALIVTLSQIATIAGCEAYSLFFSRNRNGIITLISSVAFAIILPFSFSGSSKTIFIVVYIIAYVFYNFVNYAVPVIVARNIDYRCLGQYTAWRMGLHTLGTALGSATVPLFLNLFGGTGTMIVCGITLLPCGICYYLFEKKSKV